MISGWFTKLLTRRNIILFAIFLILVLLDQVTKWLVLQKFHLGESIPVITGFFNLTYVRNTGAAFGFMAQAHPEFRVPFFLVIPLIALGVIFYVMRKLPSEEWLTSTALTLVASGAIGNLIDRMRYGFVVDFLDFHYQFQVHFPAFNVADSAITLGVGVLIMDLFVQEKEKNGVKEK